MQIHTDHLEFNSWHNRHVNDDEMNLICYNMAYYYFFWFARFIVFPLEIEGHALCIKDKFDEIIRLQLVDGIMACIHIFFLF